MEIIVNGTLAVLKAGSSFQYVSENRAFTEAEGYSLSITFPIKGCQRNIQIFGHLYRPDVRAVNSTSDCEIRDKAFVKYGSLTLIDISPEEIKAQFLEGQSAINNNIDFEQTYVNDLDLGKPISTQPTSPPYLAWSPSTWGDYVALPWCNNTDGTVHNGVTINENGDTEWDEGVKTRVQNWINIVLSGADPTATPQIANNAGQSNTQSPPDYSNNPINDIPVNNVESEDDDLPF